METYLRALMVDATSLFFRINQYRLGDFFGPVNLGLFLSRADGSIFPIFTFRVRTNSQQSRILCGLKIKLELEASGL